MGVLQRQVQVMAQTRLPSHDLDQRRADVGRVGVHQPQPVQVRCRLQNGPQETGQRIPLVPVPPVGRRILGNEDDLFDARLHQANGVRYNGFQRPADGGTLDERDGAESAGRAAAVGNFEVGRSALSGHAAAFRDLLEWIPQPGRGDRPLGLPGPDLLDQGLDLVPAAGA